MIPNVETPPVKVACISVGSVLVAWFVFDFMPCWDAFGMLVYQTRTLLCSSAVFFAANPLSPWNQFDYTPMRSDVSSTPRSLQGSWTLPWAPQLP